jgi:hypothetical protein
MKCSECQHDDATKYGHSHACSKYVSVVERLKKLDEDEALDSMRTALINTFVRDISSVVTMPKSEIRRRLDEIINF